MNGGPVTGVGLRATEVGPFPPPMDGVPERSSLLIVSVESGAISIGKSVYYLDGTWVSIYQSEYLALSTLAFSVDGHESTLFCWPRWALDSYRLRGRLLPHKVADINHTHSAIFIEQPAGVSHQSLPYKTTSSSHPRTCENPRYCRRT